MNKKPPLMQGSFEKEVRKKMEELNMTPSAPVWEKVEAEIKVEKKRRRGVFWFLIAGLLVGGGWWGYNSLKDDGQQLSVQTNRVSQKKANADTASGTNRTSKYPPDAINGGTSTQTVINDQQKNKLQDNQRTETFQIKKQHSRQGIKASMIIGRNSKNKTEQTVALSISEKNKKQNSLVTGNINNVETTKTFEEKLSSVNNINIITDTVAKQPSSFVVDSSSKLQIKKEETLPVTIDSSLKKKVAAAGKKWTKQISISIGRSSYTSGLFFNTAARGLNDVNLSVGGGPNAVRNKPSKISAGFGFTTGFLLSKQLSPKLELAFGLQYAYYSTQTSIGDKKEMDTAVSFNMDKMAVDEFFTNTGKDNYTNHFHVFEIPVKFSYQPSRKLPLFVSAGACYGRLLSTNALTFSNSSNLYYKNDQDYNRQHLPVHASVQYRFEGKKGLAIQMGPVIQYNVLKLQKENLTNIPHLSFAGLKTDIRF